MKVPWKNTACSVVVLAGWLLLLPWAGGVARAAEGIALAIVFDTSGSMRGEVRDGSGKNAPKHQIARRALGSVISRLEAVAKESTRKLEVGLFRFKGHEAEAAVKFGPFDPAPLQRWLDSFSEPRDSTPLGEAIRLAGAAVLKSPLEHKHILVLTDGVNTSGPDPAIILPRLKADADRAKQAISVHFIAFDVGAGTFAKVKQLGATVVSAADEPQLNAQLGFILEEKILLEAEDPKPNKK